MPVHPTVGIKREINGCVDFLLEPVVQVDHETALSGLDLVVVHGGITEVTAVDFRTGLAGVKITPLGDGSAGAAR